MHQLSPQKRRKRAGERLAEPTLLRLERGGPGEIAPYDVAHLRSDLRAAAASAGLLAMVQLRLSAREKTVLWLFVRHHEIRIVATQVDRCRRTVRNQLDSARKKLRMPTLNELAVSVAVAFGNFF